MHENEAMGQHPPVGLEDLQTIDAKQLAQLLGRAEKTIKNDVYARPETLPPRFQVPGTRTLRWRVSEVRAWMDEKSEEAAVERMIQLSSKRRQNLGLLGAVRQRKK